MEGKEEATTRDGTEKPIEESKAEEKADDLPAGELPLPVLPDVPTKEPTEPGQPEAKKQKISSEDTEASVKNSEGVEKL